VRPRVPRTRTWVLTRLEGTATRSTVPTSGRGDMCRLARVGVPPGPKPERRRPHGPDEAIRRAGFYVPFGRLAGHPPNEPERSILTLPHALDAGRACRPARRDSLATRRLSPSSRRILPDRVPAWRAPWARAGDATLVTGSSA